MASDIAILNAGPGDWAFRDHAECLSRVLGIPIADRPAKLNYVLACEESVAARLPHSFIPFTGIRLASDKRLLAALFRQHSVPTPTTYLAATSIEVQEILEGQQATTWCLKYPTGCGGSGHRVIRAVGDIPREWPTPYVIQEFITMVDPEVYRLYMAGGEAFGWNVRRYKPGSRMSPWVAHARGAHYEAVGEPSVAAQSAAIAALAATGLNESFGCADLLQHPDGRWLVLEVGTDGVFNHVDRTLGLPELEGELNRRLRESFWRWVETTR